MEEQMSKQPREFWIEIENECDDIVWHKPVNERTVHVIEYSAYEQEKSLRTQWAEDSSEWRNKCFEAETKAEKLAAALEELSKVDEERFGYIVDTAKQALAEYREIGENK